MRIFNYLNGIFYVLFGLYGAFLPKRMGDFMGWELNLLGSHEVRAAFLAVGSLGAMLLLYSKKRKDQKPLTLTLIFVTLSFFMGRLLGLLLDGTGPLQTYQEMGLEVFIIALGGFLYKRGK